MSDATGLHSPSTATPLPLEMWRARPLADLVHHLTEHYHAPLKAQLTQLETLARKVVREHGARQPQRLPALLDALLALSAELKLHLLEEETVLFPALLDGRLLQVAPSLAMMESDHAETRHQLFELRSLTNQYKAPEGACASWKALWAGLQQLELSLEEHMTLEAEALLERVFAGEC